MWPRTTLPSHRPCSGTGSCRRCLSWSLTSFSFARIRFEIVIRLTWKRPVPVFAQMCVKPRKSNVSGFPAPRAARRTAANRPNSIRRVLPRVQLQAESREPVAEVPQELPGLSQMLEPGDEESRRGESHPPPLAEPDVSLPAY